MSSVIIAGDTSGTVTLQAPAVAGSTTLTLPATSGTIITGTGGVTAIANGGTGQTSSTGSGAVVLATSPTLVTPALGTPSALVGTNITGTANSLNAGIGVGQTWQNVTSSRAVSTTYTNSTGKPIQVIVIQSQNNTGGSLTVDGSVRMTSTGLSGYSLPCSVTAIIPNNSTYSYNTGFGTWSELR